MYIRKTLKLDAVTSDKQTLVEPGKRIAEIFALAVPTGAVFDLLIGSNTDYVTIPAPFTMEPQGEQEANNGLYWRNTVAQAGVSVDLYIVFAGAQLNPVLVAG